MSRIFSSLHILDYNCQNIHLGWKTSTRLLEQWELADWSTTFTMIQFRLKWQWSTRSLPSLMIPLRNWHWKPSQSFLFFCHLVWHLESLDYWLKNESTNENWWTQEVLFCPWENKWRKSRSPGGNGRWRFKSFITLQKLSLLALMRHYDILDVCGFKFKECLHIPFSPAFSGMSSFW